MNIHVIFTGGTIGSTISAGNAGKIISTDPSSSSVLLKMYEQKYGDKVKFKASSPYYILSENLSAEKILLLIREINTILKDKDIEGIVVTHGTDTLQYTAALLGYVFGGADIPVLLVSSDYVLTDSRANGLINFKYAVDFIKGKYGKGVYVSYRNAGGASVIHRGTRLNGPIAFSADITSICDKYYGIFDGEKYVQCDDSAPADCGKAVSPHRTALFDDTQNIKLAYVLDGIISIMPYVGMKYPEIKDNTKVILHGSYHSGTICINDEFDRFAKSAMDKNIPIYLTGLKGGEAAYETICRYGDYGIKVLPASAFIAQYCKLWLAISNGLDIKKIMQTRVAYDYLY